MKVILAVLFSTFVFSNVYAATTTCVSRDGRFVYVAWSYDGGAPPPPEMITSTEDWRKNGVRIAYRESSGFGTSSWSPAVDVGLSNVGEQTSVEEGDQILDRFSESVVIQSLTRRPPPESDGEQKIRFPKPFHYEFRADCTGVRNKFPAP